MTMNEQIRKNSASKLLAKLSPLRRKAEVPERKDADSADLPILRQLLEIQQELKVGKDHINPERGFAYRSLSDIFDAVKPLLRKYGCVLTFHDEIKSVAPGVVHIIGTARLTNARGETFSASATVREDSSRGGLSMPQVSGSALSYCHKYAAGNLFAIDDTRTESAMDPDAVTGALTSADADDEVGVPEGKKPILQCGAAGWAEAMNLAENFRGNEEAFMAEIHRRWIAPEREDALLRAVFTSRGEVKMGSGQ